MTMSYLSEIILHITGISNDFIEHTSALRQHFVAPEDCSYYKAFEKSFTSMLELNYRVASRRWSRCNGVKEKGGRV